MAARSVRTADVGGKRVLVRADLNVPLDGARVADEVEAGVRLPPLAREAPAALLGRHRGVRAGVGELLGLGAVVAGVGVVQDRVGCNRATRRLDLVGSGAGRDIDVDDVAVEQGVAHEFTSARAREAGRKGGIAMIFTMMSIVVVAAALGLIVVRMQEAKKGTENAVDMVQLDEAAQAGIDVRRAPGDPDALAELVGRLGIDAVVIDGYEIDPRTGARLRADGVIG